MGAQQRGWGSGWPNCQPGAQTTVSGGGVRVTCRREIAPLVARALDESAATGYVIHQEQTGSYVCRPIGGTSTPSNHSWGLAVDINWNENPFTHDHNARRTITPEVVRIWKSHGFSWGGDWSGKVDLMHMEFVGTPADAARQVAALGGTPTPPPPGPAPAPGRCGEQHPLLKRGAKGRPVNHLQYLLIRGNHPIAGDGQYGPATEAAVHNFQAQKGLAQDGVCGDQTWASLHRDIDGLTI